MPVVDLAPTGTGRKISISFIITDPLVKPVHGPAAAEISTKHESRLPRRI